MTLKLLVGSNIKSLRVEHGLTLEQLGQAIGVAYQTIGRIEKGQGATDLDTIEAIAKQLGTTPAVLMGLSPAWQEVIRDFPALDQSKVRIVKRAIQAALNPMSIEDIQKLTDHKSSIPNKAKGKL